MSAIKRAPRVLRSECRRHLPPHKFASALALVCASALVSAPSARAAVATPSPTQASGSGIVGITNLSSLTSYDGAEGISAPDAIAFDRSGDLWTVNSGLDVPALVEYGPAELSRTGSPRPRVSISAASSGELSGLARLAFDLKGDLWVSSFNDDAATVLEYTPGQLARTGAPRPSAYVRFAPGVMAGITGLAFDSSGNLWAVDNYGSLFECTARALRQPIAEHLARSFSTKHVATIAVGVAAVAFSASGDLWAAVNGDSSGALSVPGSPKNALLEYTAAELARGGSPVPKAVISRSPGTSLDDPVGLAFDRSGDLWAANMANSTLVEYSVRQLGSSGSPAPAVRMSAKHGSLDDTSGLAFDTSGDLWAANLANSTLVEYSVRQLGSSGSPKPAVTVN